MSIVRFYWSCSFGPGLCFFISPGMIAPGFPGAHGEVVVTDDAAAVAPGGVDVVLLAVQGGHSPDVLRIGQGGALDALQL